MVYILADPVFGRTFAFRIYEDMGIIDLSSNEGVTIEYDMFRDSVKAILWKGVFEVETRDPEQVNDVLDAMENLLNYMIPLGEKSEPDERWRNAFRRISKT